MDLNPNAFANLRMKHLHLNLANQPLVINDYNIVGDIDLRDAQWIASLHFSNCCFTGRLFVDQNNGHNEIKFDNCFFSRTYILRR